MRMTVSKKRSQY